MVSTDSVKNNQVSVIAHFHRIETGGVTKGEHVLYVLWKINVIFQALLAICIGRPFECNWLTDEGTVMLPLLSLTFCGPLSFCCFLPDFLIVAYVWRQHLKWLKNFRLALHHSKPVVQFSCFILIPLLASEVSLCLDLIPETKYPWSFVLGNFTPFQCSC